MDRLLLLRKPRGHAARPPPSLLPPLVPPGHQSDKSARLIDPISSVLCTYFKRERSFLWIEVEEEKEEKEARGERKRVRKDPSSVRPRICMHAGSGRWELRGGWAGLESREREKSGYLFPIYVSGTSEKSDPTNHAPRASERASERAREHDKITKSCFSSSRRAE